MYQPSQKAFYAAALPVHTIMGLPVVNATSQETAEVLLADGPQRHEEIVADRHQPERPADAGLLPERLDQPGEILGERHRQDVRLPGIVLLAVDDDGNVVDEKHSTLPRGEPLTFEVTRQRLIHLKPRRTARKS